MRALKAGLYMVAAALTLSAFLMVTLSAGSVDPRVRGSDPAIPMHDAPYRDGLFQGRLAAPRGGADRPNVGRWSSDDARAHFIQGYEQAYRDALSRLQ